MSDERNIESPPPSPVLSDVVSLPDTASDLGNLSDVSGLSDDEDEISVHHSSSDNEDAGDDFEEITQSMIASSVAHTASSKGMESDDDDVDETFVKSSETTTTGTTPSASVAFDSGYDVTATPLQASMITSRDLVYPSPFNTDGRSPFGLTSLDTESTEDKELDDFSILDINGDSERVKRSNVDSSHQLAESLFKDHASVDLPKRSVVRDIAEGSSNELRNSKDPTDVPSLGDSTASFPFLARPNTPIPIAMSGDNIEVPDGISRSKTFLTPRNGYRWPTVLTFGVVGVVLAVGGVIYNASSATFSDVVAAQQANRNVLASPVSTLASRAQATLADGDVLAANNRNAALAFVSSLEPPARKSRPTAEAAEMVKQEDKKGSFAALPPSMSAVSSAANMGVSTLSSVSSALSLPVHRAKPDISNVKKEGKGNRRKNKPKASSSLSLAVVPEFAQKGLALFPSFPNLTHRDDKGEHRVDKHEGRSKKRKAKDLVAKIAQQASQYGVMTGQWKENGVLSPGQPHFDKSGYSTREVRSLGKKELARQERSKGDLMGKSKSFDSLICEDGCDQKKKGMEEDDLFQMPFDVAGSAKILPLLDFETILEWLKRSFEIYTAHLTSCLTVDPSNKEAIIKAVHNLDIWSMQAKQFLKSEMQAVRSEVEVYRKDVQKMYRRATGIKKKALGRGRKKARKLVKQMYGA